MEAIRNRRIVILLPAMLLVILGVWLSNSFVAQAVASHITKKIGASSNFTVGLRDDGTVWAWGVNDKSQLGNNKSAHNKYPVQVENLPEIKDIAVGGNFTVALAENGQVWTWGKYKLSDTSGSVITSPTIVEGLSDKNIISIAAGSSFALALTAEGQVYSWGYDDANVNHYELGQGSPSVAEAMIPKLVVGDAGTVMTGVTQIKAGMDHAIALKDGKVYSWGQNTSDALGRVNATSTAMATEIPTLSNVSMIATGPASFYSFAVSGSSVYAWGANTNGQLGTGDHASEKASPTVVPIAAGQTIKEISTGSTHTLMLLSDGSVWGAGNASFGRLGRDYEEPVYSFEKLMSVSAINSIQAGSQNSFVYKEDGTVWGFGSNQYYYQGSYTSGVLGVGFDLEYTNVPLKMYELAYFDTSPQPITDVHITADTENPTRLHITYKYPIHSEFNEVDFDIYKMDANGGSMIAHGVSQGRDDNSNNYHEISSYYLTSGKYKVDIYTKKKYSEPDQESIHQIYDNGGAGYVIEDLFIRVPLKYWNSNEEVSGAAVTLESRNDGVFVIQPTSTSNGTYSYNALEPGHYSLSISKEGYYEYYDEFILSHSRTIPFTLISISEPNFLEFVDDNDAPGKISGVLEWQSPNDPDNNDYTDFQVYFEKSNGQIVGQAVATVGRNVYDSDGYIYAEIQDLDIPSDAVILRVYKSKGGSAPTYLKATPAFTYIWDRPTAMPRNAYMIDNNHALGVVDGMIYWDGVADETGISSYVILREQEWMGGWEVVATVPAGSTTYTFPVKKELNEWDSPPIYHIAITKGDQISNLNTSVAFVDNISDHEGLTADIHDGIASPGNVSFADTDPAANKIGGELQWTYPSYKDHFEVYFLRQNDSVVEPLMSAYYDYYYSGSTDSDFPYTLRIPANTPIPEGATKLGVYLKDYFDNDNGYEEGLSKPAVINISDFIHVPSSNASLESLTTDPVVALTPVFSSSVLNYTASVSSSVYSTVITAKAQNANAIVTLNGVTAPLTVTTTVYLNQGENRIPVKVKAENGTTELTYTLIINKSAPVLSSNIQLGSLSLGDGYSLSPSFTKENTDYTVIVERYTASISVTAAVYDSRSKLSFSSSGLASPKPSSGSVTESVYLNTATTSIKIKVTAEDGSEGTYTLDVQKPTLTIKDGIGVVKDNRVEGITKGTTVGKLLSSLTLQAGVTAKVVNKTTDAAVNDLATVDSSMKLVLMVGSRVAAAYELKTLTDTLYELIGIPSGTKLQVNQLIQLITSPNKVDFTGDGKFDVADVRKILLEISPLK
ncbi:MULTISPECIES: cadherin-like beta sandwich domain-containing protein [unclassified Paenibacillus]|uniref:cadherin-like beta sandwich domain-containing protein n=1 Tax=unclassified Paenibacillus TaxID=185978 RepID=UPI0036364D86